MVGKQGEVRRLRRGFDSDIEMSALISASFALLALGKQGQFGAFGVGKWEFSAEMCDFC